MIGKIIDVASSWLERGFLVADLFFVNIRRLGHPSGGCR
jgi:hypothetical protein